MREENWKHFDDLQPRPLFVNLVPTQQQLPSILFVPSKFGRVPKGCLLSYIQLNPCRLFESTTRSNNGTVLTQFVTFRGETRTARENLFRQWENLRFSIQMVNLTIWMLKKKVQRDERMNDLLTKQNIQWQFNLNRAPGGAASSKDCLKQSMCKAIRKRSTAF